MEIRFAIWTFEQRKAIKQNPFCIPWTDWLETQESAEQHLEHGWNRNRFAGILSICRMGHSRRPSRTTWEILSMLCRTGKWTQMQWLLKISKRTLSPSTPIFSSTLLSVEKHFFIPSIWSFHASEYLICLCWFSICLLTLEKKWLCASVSSCHKQCSSCWYRKSYLQRHLRFHYSANISFLLWYWWGCQSS